MLEKAAKIIPPNRQVLPQVGDLQWRERKYGQEAADNRDTAPQRGVETTPDAAVITPRVDTFTLGEDSDSNADYGDYTAALRARAKINELDKQA